MGQQVTLGCCEFLQPEADPVIFLERAMTTLSSTKVLSHQILSLFLKFFIFNPSLLNSLTYNVYCPLFVMIVYNFILITNVF